MSKCITEYIDDYCKNTYGHTNWEFITRYDGRSDDDIPDKYHKIYEPLNIGILETLNKTYFKSKGLSKMQMKEINRDE